MDTEFDEAEFAQAALGIADQRIVLSDSTKFGKSALVKVCGFNKINRLITDAEPPPELAAPLRSAGVIVSVAMISGQSQQVVA
jgi:DeoR family transcriptional regulator, glycerol-3-phosphate regulon repressor